MEIALFVLSTCDLRGFGTDQGDAAVKLWPIETKYHFTFGKLFGTHIFQASSICKSQFSAFINFLPVVGLALKIGLLQCCHPAARLRMDRTIAILDEQSMN